MSTYGPVSYQSNLNELGDAIIAYARVYTRKDLPAILEDQASKLSCSSFGLDNQGLFQESAATAPSQDALVALPPSHGYRIRHPGRPMFTGGYELRTYKRGARKGKYRLNRRGQIVHKVIGQEGEIDRRIRHRFFQAAGWLSSRVGKYAAGAASGAGQRPDRAVVQLVLTGPVLSISITNTSPAALEVAERTGYLARALENRRRDLMEYVTRKQAEFVSSIMNHRLSAPR